MSTMSILFAYIANRKFCLQNGLKPVTHPRIRRSEILDDSLPGVALCCHSHRTQAPLVQWARYPEFANPACMISKSSLEHWPEILKRSFSHAFISKAPGGPGRTSQISHFPIRQLQRYTGEFFPSVRYGVAEWRSTRTPIRAQFLRDPHPPIQCWSRLPGLALGFSFPTLGGGVGGHV